VNKVYILVLILLFACGDTSKDSEGGASSKITNPIFLEMFKEYQGILDEYEAIMLSVDLDDFNKISNIESIAKRVSTWIDKWEKEIKEADLSHEEKIEIINEYERISRKYRN